MFVNYAFHKNLISNIGREIKFTRGKQTTHKKVGKEHKQTLLKQDIYATSNHIKKAQRH